MRAMVLRGKTLAVEEVPDPEPREGQVLARVWDLVVSELASGQRAFAFGSARAWRLGPCRGPGALPVRRADA
jgi:hypothetical protein